ncbi:MAG TPA: ATP synthase F1 subunit gamma [Candidatus Copromorpha excrementigallinarum]|uniref:ATP synthase gamma chain n=1 Tax=Candidatus Allocopromorpha excrementigallinarum TaxID=2840742 RepID=A0A9D1HZK4_9FIRM|nr:ATP synthase F1 subunit gamma [Candidatus Copromorpha excrementigallinarum]
MADSMQAIKRRIRSVTSTEHITNAMKLVSAGKLRKAKAIFEKTNENSHYITHTIAEIFNSSQEIPDKYLAGNREIKTTCYIVVTSSRGLCGGFNSNILKEAQREIDADWEEPYIFAIGSKAKEYFEKRGHKICGDYLAPPENISFLETREMSRPIIEMYNSGEIDEVVLIYTSFISSMEQEVKNVTLLPFEIERDPEIIRDTKQVEYEPSVEEVFNYLVPKYVEMMIYAAVVESATCEHAARRMAMENATDNAREMLGQLSLYYNRARQSAITDEIIEIVAGSEAQK